MEEDLHKVEMLCARHASLKLHPLSVACGAGWFPLLEAALQDLERLRSSSSNPQFSVLQAKEKFGALRLYVRVDRGTADDLAAVGTLIRRVEERSRTTCEHCGAEAQVREHEGYWSTRCGSCARDRENRGPGAT